MNWPYKLTLEATGTQQLPRSGNLLLCVRVGRPVRAAEHRPKWQKEKIVRSHAHPSPCETLNFFGVAGPQPRIHLNELSQSGSSMPSHRMVVLTILYL
jgi:hypothetical protein